MANKKISELDQTLNLSDQADFPMSQDNGGEPTTFKAKLTQIATKIAEAITFSNLKTGNKQLVSAVNQTISNLADDFNTTAGSTYAKDDCVLYNGILYQCTNSSGTTSGTFIDADWTAIKAVDVGSGGGGGSSTFEGLSDVSIDDQTLTNGQVPVYNSATHKWENGNAGGGGASSADQVSVDDTDLAYEADDVQEALEKITKRLTYAEYEALTDAEKKNGTIYFITDVNGDGQSFQPVIYSEEEREIGVWTDGKPLYEKTINLSGTFNLNNNEWTNLVNLTDYSVDSIISCDMLFSSGNEQGVNDGRVRFSYLTTTKYLRGAASTNTTVGNPTLSIRYTKTTDTAGSGTWTPQGVPAVHYSTDEQVVGTWIDGSTLYEKTFISTTVLPYNSDTVLTLNDSIPTGINVVDFKATAKCVSLNGTPVYLSENGYWIKYYYNKTNNTILGSQIFTSAGLSASESVIILRYTKSST